MKCFLHIGHEKTGTTTLQQFLFQNREILSEVGFFFPVSVGTPHHRPLSVAAYNLDRCDDFTRGRGFDSEKLDAFQQKVLSEFEKELLSISEKQVILTSEHFHSRLTTFEEIQRLKLILVSLGFEEIIVIIYLRNPPEIANSLYSTAIKAGGTLEKPKSPGEPYWNNLCNHRESLERWSSVFGEKPVVPRLFEPSAFMGGTLIDDFMDVLGLEDSGNFQRPEERLNTSLSHLGVELLRRVNQIIPRFVEGRPNPIRREIVSHFESAFKGGGYQMPQELVEEYEAAYEDSNEWVRRTYFPERECLFSEKLESVASCLNLVDQELDQVKDLIVSLWKTRL